MLERGMIRMWNISGKWWVRAKGFARPCYLRLLKGKLRWIMKAELTFCVQRIPFSAELWPSSACSHLAVGSLFYLVGGNIVIE